MLRSPSLRTAFQHRKRAAQVVAPYVAAVDQAEHQPSVERRRPVQAFLELLRCAHQIQVHRCDRQIESQFQVVAQGAEVRGEPDLKPGQIAGEAAVDTLNAGASFGVQVRYQARLIQLYPRPEPLQRAQDLAVHRQQLIDGALPLLSILIEWLCINGSGDPVALIGKWFVFWAVGVRLLLASSRQVAQPAFTAQTIFPCVSRAR